MVQNRIIKSVVERATMNRSYLSYFRNRNPFKFISNIFRNYKRSSENIKRNQSEPTVAQNQPTDAFDANKPKSEINLCSCRKEKQIQQWKNAKFDDSASQEGVNLTSSTSKVDGASSNISLKKTSCQLDLNIQEKLDKIPLEVKRNDSSKIPLKRAYPWQNFNLANVRKPRYEEIKEVSNMRDQIIKLRKSILRKPDMKSCGDRESPIKEVKFNKMASMVIYPRNNYNVMKQARINLSTNVNSVEKSPIGVFRKKKPPVLLNRNVKVCCPSNYRKSVKKIRKCLPVEQGHFWYLNNAKKQKIF